jgi:catechol 2,3-dioxygenase-like lactoylglutathione lyase family enzyme
MDFGSAGRHAQRMVTMPLVITGIDHVQIAVPRGLESQCLAFYRNVLGLAEIAKAESLRARGGAWFQLPGCELHIGVDPEPSPASKRHICFRVADIEASRIDIEAAGIQIEDELAVHGLCRFFIRDPAGNRIEIGQR